MQDCSDVVGVLPFEQFWMVIVCVSGHMHWRLKSCKFFLDIDTFYSSTGWFDRRMWERK